MRFITLLGLLLLAIVAGDRARAAREANPPRPRFEVVYTEAIPTTGHSTVPEGVSVLHDRETGHEILCFRDSTDGFKASISCVQTGRAW